MVVPNIKSIFVKEGAISVKPDISIDNLTLISGKKQYSRFYKRDLEKQLEEVKELIKENTKNNREDDYEWQKHWNFTV